MAEPEPLENGLLDEPRHFGDIGGNTKMATANDETPPVKQNGISSGQFESNTTNNQDRSDNSNGNEMDADSRQESIGDTSNPNEDSIESGGNGALDPLNNDPSKYRDINLEEGLSFSALKEAENENSVGASTDKSELLKSEVSEESRDSLSSEDNSRNTTTRVEESVDDGSLQSSGREESSPVVVKSDDSSVMEVEGEDDDLLDDDDESPTSEVVELSSNISAPNSDVMEVDDESVDNAGNNSLNPSVISEDSSKDSIDSSVSNHSENANFLNEMEDDDNVELKNSDDDIINDRSNEAEKSEIVNKDIDQKEGEKKEMENDLSKQCKEADMDKKIDDPSITLDNIESDKSIEKSELPDLTKITSSDVLSSSVTTTTSVQLPNAPDVVTTSAGFVPITNPQKQATPNHSQQGYIAKIGNQHVFVPMSNAPGFKGQLYPAVAEPVNAASPKTGIPSQQPIKPEDLMPKSSLEMMELMKWELQNRIPDNYNWSVAFHPKKDELSTVTSFLLDLGHDVVKEAVYKDIIEIQTKKRESGTLKETEVDSLGKMKMVYENTRKRVEHLNLPMKKCKRCRFKTESEVIMRFHTDHPHYEPYWDHPSAQFCCSHCYFRTKQAPEFSFHMETVHGLQAKMIEKPSWFPCEMCPLDPSSKVKLSKHRLKCLKSFKLNINLQPYYHDVNFCMKTCYYKPKKVIPKPIPAKKPQPQPALQVRPPMNTRSNPSLMPVAQVRPPNIQQPFASRPNMGVRTPIMYAPQGQNRAIRSNMHPIRHIQPTRLTIPTRPPVVRDLLHQASIPRQNLPPGLQARLAMTQARQQPPVRPPVKPPGKEMSGFEVCELCGGYVKDRQALRIHFYYAHKVEMPQAIFNRPTPPLCCEVCQSRFWTTQGLSKHKATLRHYQSVNSAAKQATSAAAGNDQQCFMCTRRVPNLFVHIEQIHGMTMKDLVAMKKCIMCGITAADRRQLEIHMASAHGVLIKANDFLGPEKPPAVKSPAPPVKPETPAASPSTTKGGKALVRNNLCVFCQVQFADNTQLTLHCIKNHATCRACGMVVASNKHLANHHCKKMMRDCVICGLRKLSPDSYALHVKKHVKPCKIKIMRLTEEDIKSAREKIKREYKPQVISLDSDDDSDVEVVDDDNKAEAKKNDVDSSKDNNQTENSEPQTVDEIKEEIKEESAESLKESLELKSDEDSEVKIENENSSGKNSEAEEKSNISEITGENDESSTECGVDELKKATPSDTKMEHEDSLTEIEKPDIETESETHIKQESAANKEPDMEENNTSDTNVEEYNANAKSEEAENAELDVKTERPHEFDMGIETSRKRKISDSDCDEDVLLRDDSESKRLKFEKDCHSDEGSDQDNNLGVEGIDMSLPNTNPDMDRDYDTDIKADGDVSNDGSEYGTTNHPSDDAGIKIESDMAVDDH